MTREKGFNQTRVRAYLYSAGAQPAVGMHSRFAPVSLHKRELKARMSLLNRP